jgi:hypothetical protein
VKRRINRQEVKGYWKSLFYPVNSAATNAVLTRSWCYSNLPFSWQKTAWREFREMPATPCMEAMATPDAIADRAAYTMSCVSDKVSRKRLSFPKVAKFGSDYRVKEFRQKLIRLAFFADEVPSRLVGYFRVTDSEQLSAFSVGFVPKPREERGNRNGLTSKFEMLVALRKAREFNGYELLPRHSKAGNTGNSAMQFAPIVIYPDEYARMRERLRCLGSQMESQWRKQDLEAEKKGMKKRARSKRPSLDKVIKEPSLTHGDLARFLGVDNRKLTVLLRYLGRYEWACFINDDRHKARRTQEIRDLLSDVATQLTLEMACMHCAERKAVTEPVPERAEWNVWFAANIKRYCSPSDAEFDSTALWLRDFAKRCFESLPEHLKERAEELIDPSGALTLSRLPWRGRAKPDDVSTHATLDFEGDFPVTVRALCSVNYSADKAKVPTGEMDEQGRLLFAVPEEFHETGTTFEIDDGLTLQRLLEAGAIEILGDGWNDLIEAARRVLARERGWPEMGAEFSVGRTFDGADPIIAEFADGTRLVARGGEAVYEPITAAGCSRTSG